MIETFTDNWGKVYGILSSDFREQLDECSGGMQNLARLLKNISFDDNGTMSISTETDNGPVEVINGVKYDGDGYITW